MEVGEGGDGYIKFFFLTQAGELHNAQLDVQSLIGCCLESSVYRTQQRDGRKEEAYVAGGALLLVTLKQRARYLQQR